jgi:hypothetical protein
MGYLRPALDGSGYVVDVALPGQPENQLQHCCRCQWTAGYSRYCRNPRARFGPDCADVLRIKDNVKFPRYNEVATANIKPHKKP